MDRRLQLQPPCLEKKPPPVARRINRPTMNSLFPHLPPHTRLRILDAICLAVLCVILSLGLWPFHSPQNHVAWLPDRNGLRLGRPATVIGAGPFSLAGAEAAAAGSLEIWLQPQRIWDSATFLAFYAAGNPRRLLLRQSLTDLEVRSGMARFYVANAFRRPAPIFLTITAGPSGTTVYADGAVARRAPQFHFSAQDLAGRIILGDSPAQPDNWAGDVRGLAVFNRELTPAQVQRHYQTWTREGRPDLSTEEHNAALYLFNERSGRVVRDRAGSGVDLFIPERYVVVDKIALEPFWDEFSFSRSYWDSVVKNIVGFLPLGFFFYPYLLLHRFRRPALATVILGTLVSLTMEILQAYLPTRDSGTTDILTNTLGTWLGLVIFRAANGLLVRRFQTSLIP